MNEINHECYVSLEVAKLLKEAGFDWKCDRFYDCTNSDCVRYEEYSAPILAVAQKWLREIKNIDINIEISISNESTLEYSYWAWLHNISNITRIIHYDCLGYAYQYDSYEEAQEAGIKKVLELILGKGK